MPRRPLFQPRPSDEVDDEFAFHVEMRTRELIARGVYPEAARRQAVARFGDLVAVADTCKSIATEREQTMRRREYLTELRDDVRFAARQLLRLPGFTVVAVLTLALGIGATTAIFSAVRAVVLRPFAYHDPDRVVVVGERWGPHATANVSAGNYVDWVEQARSFEQLSAAQYSSLTVTDGEAAERLPGAFVTWNYFATFGVRPIMGRGFTAEEDRPGQDQVVVLSQRLWERRFGADPAVLGRTLRINGRQHEIIGVLPAAFDPALAGEELWVPIAFTPARRAMHDEHYLDVFGLLKPGLSLAQVQRELDAIADVQRRRYPVENDKRGIGVVRLDEWVVGDFDRRLMVVLGAVSFVLLIACGNVANLLLARGAARARELAIRTAIGAGRGRIARQLLTESVVLALAGAVAGLAFAWMLVRTLVARAPASIPRIGETRIDGSVLAFTLGISVLSAVVFGIVPALRAGRVDVQAALKEGGRGQGQLGPVRDRLRSVLVVAQVALSLTLLVGAGLLVRSALHLSRVDPGFRADGLLTARVPLSHPGDREADRAAAARAFEAILARLKQDPGVALAALTSQAPMGLGGGSNGLLPEGREPGADNVIVSRFRMVVPGYFRTMGIPLERGRDFTEQDTRSSPLVAIVSEEVARQAWPDEDPIGKRLDCCEAAGPGGPRWKTVVGVARDVRSDGPAGRVRPEFYLPMKQVPDAAWTWIGFTATVVVRAQPGLASAAASLAPAVRAAVRAVDPTVPVYAVTTMDESLRRSTATQRFNTFLLGSLGVIGLVLAAAGIYSVITYFVSLRTREIGIRIALGATRGDVLRLVSWQGLRPVLAGVALGTIGAAWATRLLAGNLYGVRPGDPTTFAAVAALMIVVALLATVVPARRAVRVQPTQALAS